MPQAATNKTNVDHIDSTITDLLLQKSQIRPDQAHFAKNNRQDFMFLLILLLYTV